MREYFNYFLFVFTLIFGVVFYDLIGQIFGFSYMDEILCAVLFLNWIAYGRKDAIEFLILGGVFLFYLIWSLSFPHNVSSAIWMDFLIEIKPFIAFYSVLYTSCYININHRRKIKNLCLILASFLLPVGILGFGGTGVMIDMGGHARFATMCIVLGTCYVYFSERENKDLWIALLIFAIGLMSTRSKMFGFFVIYAGIMFVWHKKWAKKLFTIRNLLLLLFISVTALYFAWAKIAYYFIEGDEAGFARPVLYHGMFRILNDYPVFGTGFGSYACHASAVWYSPLYLKYVSESSELMRGLYLSDTYYPCLAQFGFVGIAFYVSFWVKRLFQSVEIRRKDIVSYKMIVVITIFFIIESVADSTFTHNRGMVMMMMLALFLKPIYKKHQKLKVFKNS